MKKTMAPEKLLVVIECREAESGKAWLERLNDYSLEGLDAEAAYALTDAKARASKFVASEIAASKRIEAMHKYWEQLKRRHPDLAEDAKVRNAKTKGEAKRRVKRILHERSVARG